MKSKLNQVDIKVSLVVPVYNEQANIASLATEISEAMANCNSAWECIWVDDGSLDDTYSEISNLPKPHLGLRLIKNQGQSRALGAGVAASRGQFVVTLDGDGQNNPSDVPRMLAKVESGYDLVQGRRTERKDKFLRKFLSRLANQFAKKLLDSPFSDLGCTLRVVRREFIENLEFLGEIHRVLPFYLAANGAKAIEIDVDHRPRIHGESKYGYSRILKFLLDLILLKFLISFREKQLYFFGVLSLVTVLLGTSAISLAVIMRLTNFRDYLDSSLMIGGIIMIVNSVIFIGLGLIGEILARLFSRLEKIK